MLSFGYIVSMLGTEIQTIQAKLQQSEKGAVYKAGVLSKTVGNFSGL